jgi:hypothetical protein
MAYRRLDPEKIIATTATLRRRIEERFPGSGLGQVAGELSTLASHAAERSRRMQRPNWALRSGAILLVLACIGVISVAATALRLREEPLTLSELIQDIDSVLASTVFLGAAVIYLLSLETRWKRRRVLAALHELRSMAHIVDMHQLTKDPEVTAGEPRPTPSSPQRAMTPFELARYLDYASEMLSLISKIAALYVQDFEDSMALSAVDEVESLTTGLSRKVWQKIMILDRVLAQPKP